MRFGLLPNLLGFLFFLSAFLAGHSVNCLKFSFRLATTWRIYCLVGFTGMVAVALEMWVSYVWSETAGNCFCQIPM